MSKLILHDPDVMNMLVKNVVGDSGIEDYFSAKSEWKTGKRSDMELTAKQTPAEPVLRT
ncbi:hypothetical protein BDC45DRAFT_572458 [Circinella umbellata]|nr:hypothetical protein BDC45DRAFT_572458 [Circinella umbellata]